MIVVFKTGRSPQALGRARPSGAAAHPITAVEKACRYLIWWITIIKYNLKARAFLAGRFRPIGITSTER
jgi:hypothetical protein